MKSLKISVEQKGEYFCLFIGLLLLFSFFDTVSTGTGRGEQAKFIWIILLLLVASVSVGSFSACANDSHLPYFSPVISNELFVEEANIKQIGVERLSQMANHYQSNQFKFGNFYTWHFINGYATEILACSSDSENRQSIIECVQNPASFGNIQFQLITSYELNEIIWLDDADVQNLSQSLTLLSACK